MLFELTRPVRQALSAHVTLDEVERWLKLSYRPDGSFGETWLVLTPQYLFLGDAHAFSAPAFEKLLPPVLITLSGIKFALVVMFYMHLKTDHKLFTAIFTVPLLIALAVGVALLFLFGVFLG